MDDSTPNYEENFQVNEKGALEKWAGKIVSVELRDENGGFLKDLDVEECKTYKEIRRKEMHTYWSYFDEKGFTTEQIIDVIRDKMKYHPKEFNEFLKDII